MMKIKLLTKTDGSFMVTCTNGNSIDEVYHYDIYTNASHAFYNCIKKYKDMNCKVEHYNECEIYELLIMKFINNEQLTNTSIESDRFKYHGLSDIYKDKHWYTYRINNCDFDLFVS